jgi:hypothetical protein
MQDAVTNFFAPSHQLLLPLLLLLPVIAGGLHTAAHFPCWHCSLQYLWQQCLLLLLLLLLQIETSVAAALLAAAAAAGRATPGVTTYCIIVLC